MKSEPHIIIDSTKSKGSSFADFFRYKDLLYYMVLRDVTVMYKQSVLGFAWAFINPVFSMIVFTIIFGTLAGVPHEDIPYSIFSYTALIPWTYFSGTLTASSSSLIGNASIFTKVYFPRLIIPLTPVFSKLVDFAISFILLVVLMFYHHYYPTVKLLLLIPLIVMLICTGIGMGTFLSSLALQYRDIRFAIGFLTPLLMYAAPVVFPASLIEQKFGHTAYMVYGLYPLSGIIEGFRAAVITTKAIPWNLIGMSCIGTVIILVVGLKTFRSLEDKFADVA
jgi:lipopolysaccharide transport system permease protein